MEMGPPRCGVAGGRRPVRDGPAGPGGTVRAGGTPHPVRCTAITDRTRRGGVVGLTKDDVRRVLDVYIRAWQEQDPALIVTIFTPGASYHERVLGEPIPDREAIRRYWQTKVVQEQANIQCELLSLYLDGDTAIAEWLAEFDDVSDGVRKRMREIAVLTFEDGLISSLREYWASEDVGELSASVVAMPARPRSH